MLEPPEPVPDAPAVSAALSSLLARARAAGVPVIHVRNTGDAGDPDEPGTPGWELALPTEPSESIVDKGECDAFAGTPLGTLVSPAAEVIVAGMQSEYCIRETTLGALRRGNRVVLAAGAHTTYDGKQSASAVAQSIEDELAAAGATITPHEKVIFTTE